MAITIHSKYKYFDSTAQKAEDRWQKFHFCRLPFAVNAMLNLSNVQGQISEHIFAPNGDCCLYYPSNLFRNGRSFENWGIYMSFAGWEVRIVKNCDRGLENAARGHRPRAAISSRRSQFSTIRTGPKPEKTYLFISCYKLAYKWVYATTNHRKN